MLSHCGRGKRLFSPCFKFLRVLSASSPAQDAGEEEVPYEARSERVSDPSWARGHLGGHQETRAIRIPRMRTKTVQNFQFGQ